MLTERISIEELKIKDATLGFSDSSVSVEGVTIDLPMNEIVRVNGERGVGKSYFLKVLAALIPLNKGCYFINGENVCDMNFDELLKFRLNIGYSFEYGGLLSNMTLYENLMFPIMYHKLMEPKEAKHYVLKLLKEFNLLDARNKRPSFVSGSMRKEVCVLRSMVLQPEVLLLDNPTIGFNQENVAKLKQFIKLNKKIGKIKHVFIVSDDESFVNDLITKDFEISWTLNENVA